MFWFFLFFMTMIFFSEVKIYNLGLWYIVSISLSITIGSLLIPSQVLPRREKYYTFEEIISFFKIRSPVIMLLISIFSISAILGVISLLLFGINRYALTYNIFSLLSLPGMIYDDRDAGILLIPWYIKYLTYFIMPAALLAGFIVPFKKLPSKLICYMPIILAILVGMIYTTRASILLAIILFISGVLSSYVLLNKDENLLYNIKTIIVTLFIIILLLGAWIFLQWLRGGASSEFILLPIFDLIKTAALGTTTAFTTWFQYSQHNGITYGLYTFAGPMDLIGLNDRELGFYKDFIALPNGYTNIYTAFRGLIHDFSVPGSICVCLFIGIIAQLSYYRCRDGNIIWVIPLSLFFAYTLFSPFISIFSSNSVTIAWIVSFFILYKYNSERLINY